MADSSDQQPTNEKVANGNDAQQTEEKDVAQPDTSQETSTKKDSGADAEKKNEGDKDKKEDSEDKKSSSDKKKDGPAGGHNETPIPNPPSGSVGYTLKITMHKASNLIIGDVQTLSSDPYVLAQMNTDVSMRHKEDPYLRFRSITVRRTTTPEWNESWIVANVPSTGFKLKLRIYDEDPADHDDLLGKAHISVDSISDSWTGIDKESYKLSLKQSSKRGLLVRSIAACFRAVPQHLQGEITVSIENLGRTGDDGQNGRVYTIGECRWFRHYSPILGRLTKTKDPSQVKAKESSPDGKQQKQIEKYNFQANQFQLQGPVPAELYHRFVEFRPWVKRMFTTTGLQGVVLGKALHHQHARVYNFGRSTVFGHFPDGPCDEMTRKFLELVHYDQGGRIYTYVITLDALWRFTETGKEFGVDMLSKHTMHSDVSIFIAFSGEFFIRRLKHPRRPEPPHPTESTSQQKSPEHEENKTHPPDDIDSGPPNEDPPHDPKYYELVIDNDSGTYRPNAQMLPLLAKFLSRSLPGLHIKTLDCQADADKMARMKDEQRERKNREGDHIIYAQGSRSSSISSSDAEDLDRIQAEYQNGDSTEDRANIRSGDGGAREHGTSKAVARDFKQHQAARWNKVKRGYGKSKEGDEENAPTTEG